VWTVPPACYEFRLRGHLDRRARERFAPLTAADEPPCTVLRGPIRDQAELHGVLARVRSSGLELVEVRPIAPGRL
jgi:hypothetical protein